MFNIPETIFKSIESQVAALDSQPKVIRNRSWADRIDELPSISLYLEGDDVPDDDTSPDSIFHSVYHEMEMRFEFTVAKVENEEVSDTLYQLINAVTKRFHAQLETMRKQAPGLVQIIESDMSAVEIDNELATVVAKADKTYIARYKQPR